MLKLRLSFLVETADKVTFTIMCWTKNWSSFSARTQPLPFPAGAAVITKHLEELCEVAVG